LGQIKADGLRGRAITRDLDWGIPVPVDGWAGKCLYVWFEAVIGYLSATIEWASINDQPEAWKDWWYNPEACGYYFIGKDNIPFHAVIWPGQLIGSGEAFGEIFAQETGRQLVLPFDIPANEFLNLEGKKISGSRNWVVDGLDFLSRYDPDPLRYYLTTNMPETKDTDWDWDGFLHRNNDELVATWGNLVNRVLSFAYKHWQGLVPEPGELRPDDQALLEKIAEGFNRVGELIDQVHLRAALAEAFSLAAEVNKYLDTTGPWFEIKTDKSQAAKSIFTAIRAIDSLKVLLAPFLPFTSQQLHNYLGYETPLFGTQETDQVQDDLGGHQVLRYFPGDAQANWQPSQIEPGHRLLKPQPLFRKLDEEIVAAERARLGQAAA
jgi:methionyl-tRNA synthetase